MIEAFLAYLTGLQKASLHTIEAYRRDLEGLQAFCRAEYGFDPFGGVEAWRRLSRPMLWAWLGTFCRATTRARKVAAIRRFDAYVRRVLRQPGLTWRPATPRLPRSLPRALPENSLLLTLQSLAERTPDFPTLRDRLALELLYGCGLRRSEAASLKVDQVHFSLRQLHILGKGSKWRVIPLYEELEALLKAYLPHRNQLGVSHNFLLCTDQGAPLYAKALYRLVRRYLGTYPHALRHSIATHLLARGASVQAVKELLGHSSLATTQKYLAITPEALKEAYLRLHPRA